MVVSHNSVSNQCPWLNYTDTETSGDAIVPNDVSEVSAKFTST